MAEKSTKEYDHTKDEILKAERVKASRSVIRVCLRSYNGGEAKIELTRRSEDGDRRFKLGRLTPEEARGVVKAIEAILL